MANASGAFSGAADGAAAGAAAGSIIPGIGTILGGIGGGLAGLIGGIFGNDNQPKPQLANIMQPVNADQANRAYLQTQQGLQQQQDFLHALSAQGGIGNQASVFGQQQALAGQLQQNALGQGPNPAQAALAQQTGNNVAQQSALMAGQRGGAANVGLLGRQAAMQGANTQQQAVGQSATLQAQQQLAAQQQLGQQQANMSGLASQQVSQQGNALNAYNAGAQGQQGQLLGGIQGYNNAAIANQGNLNSNNTAINLQNQSQQNSAIGGAIGGIGSAFGAIKLAHGGEVPDLQNGNGFNLPEPTPTPSIPTLLQFKSKSLGDMQPSSFAAQFMQHLAHGGMAVPGRAEVAGDSPKNDKVPAMLSPGEVVLPRSVMEQPNAAEHARRFVEALMLKKTPVKS